MRIVNFRQVIKRSRLLGEGQHIFAPIVLNADVALLNIDVRCPIFTHGSELHQVTVGQEFLDREENIQRADYVIHLGEHGVAAVDHGIRRGTLLGEMHDGLGLEALHHRAHKLVVGDVPYK